MPSVTEHFELLASRLRDNAEKARIAIRDGTTGGQDLAVLDTRAFVETLTALNADIPNRGNLLTNVEQRGDDLIESMRSGPSSLPAGLRGNYDDAVERIKARALSVRGTSDIRERLPFLALAILFGGLQVAAIARTDDDVFAGLTLSAMLRTIFMYGGTLKDVTFDATRATDLGWQRSVVNAPILAASLFLSPEDPNSKPPGYVAGTTAATLTLIIGYVVLKLRRRWNASRLTFATAAHLASPESVPDEQLREIVTGLRSEGERWRTFIETLKDVRSRYGLSPNAKGVTDDLIGAMTELANGLDLTLVDSNRTPEQNSLTVAGALFAAGTVYLSWSQPSAAISFLTWAVFYTFRLDDIAQQPGTDIVSSSRQFIQSGGLSMVFTPWLISAYLKAHGATIDAQAYGTTVKVIPPVINITFIHLLAPLILNGWKKTAAARGALSAGIAADKWLAPMVRFVQATASPATQALARAFTKLLRKLGANRSEQARLYVQKVRERLDGLPPLDGADPIDIALATFEEAANNPTAGTDAETASRALRQLAFEANASFQTSASPGNLGEDPKAPRTATINWTIGGRSFDYEQAGSHNILDGLYYALDLFLGGEKME